MFGSSSASPPTTDQPPKSAKSRFLQAFYRRAMPSSLTSTVAAQPQSTPVSPVSTTSSTSNSASQHTDSHSRTTISSYAMLGNIRRRTKPPIATVEVARPAPEVEFTRTMDHAPPSLGTESLPHGSASLLSLRASQQGPGFSPRPPARLPPYDNGSSDGVTHRDPATTSPFRDAQRPATSMGTAPGATRTAATTAAAPNQPTGGVRNSVVSMASHYFSDERDVPFRANAVEIAAQDDRNECAFLSHETAAPNSEVERARSILPQLLGQLHPTTAFGQGVRPEPRSDRDALRDVQTGSRLYTELVAVDGFNAMACNRVQRIQEASVMGQFARQHLAAIIRQLLDEIDVGIEGGWDQVVYDLALSAVQRVRPNVRAGDNMDLRRYVRIKRIPGGSPSDSQYVCGVVFTKDLAHRRMPRCIDHPQVMLLTLPMELSAPSKYASFEDELRLQQGFTEKLVQRIADAAPHLVLSEKIVPRGVLEGLMQHHIAVVHGVKRSVIRAVARCTAADVVSSMDRFSDYPRVGTCHSFVVQTFEHDSLAEYRKSFVFLDGCMEQLGGTIVLRGESFARLGDIKQVVDLVVCLAYSMYLEGALLLNEFALAAPGNYEISLGQHEPPSTDDSLALQALSEYKIVLSSSPSVRIPPPHVLVSMRERELAIQAITARFNKMSSIRRDTTQTSDMGSTTGGASGVAFLVSRQQQSASSISRMRQQYESEIALHESYIHAGEIFLSANPHAVSLWDYQSIVVAYMVTCRKHDYLVCLGPQYHPIAFYSHIDVTLGQYLEEMCFDLRYDCPNGNNRRCSHPMYEHKRSYIHNHGRIDVTMDEYPCPIERLSECILMWSECKRCKKHSPVTRMSDETWRYSFGKYLETTFYNVPLPPRASMCPHDTHQDHVRCFALRNMVVRFKYSAFSIWSIATPTTPLYFNMEVSIRLKEQEAAGLRTRLDAYYTSLLSRLEAFPRDLVYPSKAEECRHVLQSLVARAATEQVYFQQSLEQTIRNTHPADTLVVVVVYEALQAKVVEWNLQFSELAQTFIQLDANNRPSFPKRTTTGTGEEPQGPQGAGVATGAIDIKDHEIDALEIIDELHSAADHHYVPQQIESTTGTTAFFAMPRLCPSPTAEQQDSATTAAANAAAGLSRCNSLTGRESPEMSRLHRRLSMEAMRKERDRMERAQEKQRRANEALEIRQRHAKAAANGPSKGTAVPTQPDQQGSQKQHSVAQGAGKWAAGEHHQGFSVAAEKHPAAISGGTGNAYSTTRLIGGVATDIDVDMRPQGQTEFPELRGRRGKSKTKFTAGYGSKITQPLFDILHRALPSTDRPGAPETLGEDDTAGKETLPPSRIPGIRTQPNSAIQQQQRQRGHQYEPGEMPESDSAPVSRTQSRPLSSFGKPPDIGNSNIPRPPNIRGRPPSPSPAADLGAAPEETNSRSSSNVFLRLAKRLNSARGQHTGASSGAVLGTVPRKMNLLLPAAAQYISQHPRRPAMSQVQVFYTKPASDDSARKGAPTRRHSYQPSADQLDDIDDGPMSIDASSSRRTQFAEVPNSDNSYSSQHYVDQDSVESQRQRSLRLRSATVSQISSKASRQRDSDIGHGGESEPPMKILEQSPSHGAHMGSDIPTASTSTLSASTQTRQSALPGPTRKPSVASRATSIIPSITRRLGLGFGFRSSASRNPSGASRHNETDLGATTDESESSAAAAAKDSRFGRRPIPPQLTIARKDSFSDSPLGPPAAVRRRPRRSSGKMTELSESRSPRKTETISSVSSSEDSGSSDSGSEMDTDSDDGNGSIDDALPTYTRNILRTPLGTASRSVRTSHHLDSASMSSTPQMDLFMSSPLRPTPHQSSMLTNRSQQPPPALLSDMESSSGTRQSIPNLLESTRRPYLRMRQDSSTDEDELDQHGPDLHFGQSDAGSDAENAESTSDQEAKSATAYLQSVIDSGAADFPADLADQTELPLSKISSFESGLDTTPVATTTAESGGVSAGGGDSSTAIALPQENMSTLWKTISNLLMAPGSSQLFQLGLDLTYPLDPTEHVIAGSPVIVREAEPSSIIAFTLLASEYRKTLHSIFENAKEEIKADGNMADETAAHPRSRRSSSASSENATELPISHINEFMQSDTQQIQQQQTAMGDDAIIEHIMLHSPRHHLRFRFTAGQTKFVCNVFYAAQFEALRRCNNCEDSYIESLSRCMPYIAKGGKSGSAFLRTRDERFIIKQVQKAESDAFLKFAPFYFEHMYRTYRDVMLTALVKIFGFCRISYLNASTGKQVKMNVVIMENLFYERKCSPVFDLKGSERNRMVEETSNDVVLQDENLIKHIRQNPICIRQQTKRHLHDAIWNDTLFLSKMNVMDYSLLVGFDEKSGELVVGIVDFIRTFTWDKKLESWVKEAGILGGGGKGPTIVSPKQYKNRFREAMERYFLMVPDKFYVLPEEEDT
ncbi:Mitochondrial distribution and morphology protein 12 [Coemansia sp. Benny D115]|nr:Mitochondrial distribution and morphology protein 12 [Coemansia sp. Benny D115]